MRLALLPPQPPVTETAAARTAPPMRLAGIDRDRAFHAYCTGYCDPAWQRMVIEDIDGECVLPGDPLAASLASRRWPADADTAAAAHLLDSDLYV